MPAYLLFDRVITGFAELSVAVRIHTADYNSTGVFAGLQLISGRNGSLAVYVGNGLATKGDIDIPCRAIAHRQLLHDVQVYVRDAFDGEGNVRPSIRIPPNSLRRLSCRLKLSNMIAKLSKKTKDYITDYFRKRNFLIP